MKPERWQQVEELFQAALAGAPESRPSFLDETCAADPALRHEVEQLLVSFDAVGSFLETPAADHLGFVERPAAAPALSPGQRLAHYEIVSLLGVGGMGEVYLARDTTLDRQIALKLLPAHFAADPERVRRFEREARAASALNDPNIITIHEIGQEEGNHFIATEYIAGETLRQRLKGGPLAPGEAVAIAGQIAGALSAAHQAGLVHRDIKPENVMIWPDGLVKVLDFGLAKTVHEEPERPTNAATRNPTLETDPDLLIGTLNYLSPEQVRCERLDPRTDLFSLGVVLYEMLAGARPFEDATAAEICAAILHREPSPLAGAPLLSRIVTRTLVKERDLRYQSAADLQTDLAAVARMLQAWPASRRRTRRAVALVALAIVLFVFAFRLWDSRRVARTLLPNFTAAAAQKLTNLPGQELFPSISPDGQSVIFASRHQGNWDIYQQAAGERMALNLTERSASAELQPAYSPDGRQIAFRSSRNGGGVFVMNSDGSTITQLTDAGFNPAWSPDGSELAVADDICWDYEDRNPYPSASRLWAVTVATHERRVITPRDAVQPNWSPHGQRIAFWGEQKGGHRDIWTVASPGGEPTPVTDDAFIDWNPIWSPGGEQLYFLSNRGGEMNLWRVALDENTGRVLGEPEPATLPSNNCQYVNFARNGSRLVYGQSSRSENLWQIAFDPTRGQVSGPATQLTQGLKRYAMFSMAPDEGSFVYLARGEPQQDLFTADLAGAPRRRLTDDAAQDIVPRCSPDGRWIAFLSDRAGKYEIWKVRPDGAGLEQMTDMPGQEVIDPVWSPDSKRLLYQIRNINSFIIYADHPGATQTPQALPGKAPPGFLVWDWSPTGEYLAGWQPAMAAPQERGIVVYSFAQQRYERVAYTGAFPIWLNDNRRLVFREGGALYLVDRRGGKPKEIHSLKQPNQIGGHALSRDNRRLYFTDVSSEADIWLLNLQ